MVDPADVELPQVDRRDLRGQAAGAAQLQRALDVRHHAARGDAQAHRGLLGLCRASSTGRSGASWRRSNGSGSRATPPCSSPATTGSSPARIVCTTRTWRMQRGDPPHPRASLRIPGGPAGQVRTEFVSLLDCTATILELAGHRPGAGGGLAQPAAAGPAAGTWTGPRTSSASSTRPLPVPAAHAQGGPLQACGQPRLRQRALRPGDRSRRALERLRHPEQDGVRAG